MLVTVSASCLKPQSSGRSSLEGRASLTSGLGLTLFLAGLGLTLFLAPLREGDKNEAQNHFLLLGVL